MGSKGHQPTPDQVWLRNCEEETVEPVEGKLTGTIPSWLSGRLTRNGPGKTQYGDTKYNHLFDGSAYIHQFNINDGAVTYQSRFLQSETYQRNSSANRIVVSEFGTIAHPDPCKTILQRFMSKFEPSKLGTDNCVVSVVHVGDQMYALTETPILRRLDTNTLECVGGKTLLQDYVAVNQATAHPHVDPDGTLYNMGNSYSSKGGPTYNIIKIPPAKEVDGKEVSAFEQAEIVASIPCQWKMYPSYYHSFGIAQDYFVFVEQPLVLNMKKFLLAHFMGRPYLGAMDWYPDKKAKFRVVRRDTGEMLPTVYAADAFATFHHTNAYVKDGQLIVDLCAFDDGDVVNQVSMKNLENPDFVSPTGTVANHRRFVLPLAVEDAPLDTNLVTVEGVKCSAYKRDGNVVEVTGQLLSEQCFDLPRINYKYNGQQYRYAYGVDVFAKGVQFCKVVKMDVDSGETWLWSEEGKLVSEPVFVAAPDATHEDHGIVLSTLIDKCDPRFVALLVLDAATWTEVGRVEFQANGTVPSSFHGQFAATNEAVHLF